MTLIESMDSVVFAWGPFEFELAARPIPILSPCFALDKVKIKIYTQRRKINWKNEEKFKKVS